MKEKIINYIETLEAKSLQVDDYFKQRNDLYISNQEKDKEIERLNNIINELEQYGKERFNEYEAWKEECKNLCYINGITEMLDKLQELKGDGSNEL